VARTLLLIRHAKAVADAGTDAQRPLAPRGVRDARAVGRWLAEHQLAPDQVLVSPARRTVQTWETAAAGFSAAPMVTTDRRIYENTIESLLAVIQEAAAGTDVLAVVGHNPSMHGLALALDDGLGDERLRADVAGAFPTSGIAVLDVATGWAELGLGGATLRQFAVPRG
jgi:phosphohistidine phosphatase